MVRRPHRGPGPEQPGGPPHELRPASHRAYPRRAGPDARRGRPSSLDELASAALPPQITDDSSSACPSRSARPEPRPSCAGSRARTRSSRSMIGLGYYGTMTPAVIRRNLLENPGWYTAYTPYQPEISQGRLEALLNFQTMVADLTALPVAGASLLDEATAAAEAMTLRPAGHRQRQRLPGRHRLPAADARGAAHPGGAARASGWSWRTPPPRSSPRSPRASCSACCCSTRASAARCVTWRRRSRRRTERGAQVAVAADLLALTLLRPPGEMGADIAVGTTQRFGVPMGFGGPHAGYISVRDGLKRQLPGRLVGRLAGRRRPARLPARPAGQGAAHQAGEGHQQHLHGAGAARGHRRHVRDLPRARRAHRHRPAGAPPGRRAGRHAARAAASTRQRRASSTRCRCAGLAARPTPCSGPARPAYNLYLADADTFQIACDETTSEEQLAAGRRRSASAASRPVADPADALPAGLRRTSEFLTHPVFREHRTETGMLATCAAWPTSTSRWTGP